MRADRERGRPPTGVPALRLALGLVVVPVAALAGALLYGNAVHDRLPAPMATHWSAGGITNGTSSYGTFLLMVLGLGVLLWSIGAAAVVAGRGVRVRHAAERFAMCWCGGTTAFVSSLAVLTIAVNVDRGAASAVTLPAIDIVLPLGFAVLGAVVGFALAGRRPPSEAPATITTRQDAVPIIAPHLASPEARVPPALTIDLATHPVWQRHLVSRLMVVLAAVAAVLGVVFVFLLPFVSLTFVVVAVAMVPFTSVSAAVDDSGLHVRLGPFGWPRKHVRIDDIAAVASDVIEPLEWGGWGYRVMPGRSAIVARRGPGIVVEQRDGRAFAVTIDDPDAGAALLEAYRRAANG
jgi:hypothetical protein